MHTKLIRRSRVTQAVLTGIVLSGLLGLGHVLAETFTSDASPSDYAVVTLRHAREDLEDLKQAIFSTRLSPSDLQERLRQIASRNKKGVHTTNDTRSSDHVIDITGMTIPTLPKKKKDYFSLCWMACRMPAGLASLVSFSMNPFF